MRFKTALLGLFALAALAATPAMLDRYDKMDSTVADSATIDCKTTMVVLEHTTACGATPEARESRLVPFDVKEVAVHRLPQPDETTVVLRVDDLAEPNRLNWRGSENLEFLIGDASERYRVDDSMEHTMPAVMDMRSRVTGDGNHRWGVGPGTKRINKFGSGSFVWST